MSSQGIAASLIALSLAVAGCGPRDAGAPAPDGTSPDVLLVLVAGLRADATDAPGAASAALDPLGGARFRAAYAQSSSSFVSLGSLLTGRYPSAIPLCGPFTGGYSALWQSGRDSRSSGEHAWCAALPDDRRTLPELLGSYGYRSCLLSAGPEGVERLARGFDTHVDVSASDDDGDRITDWARLRRAAVRWWADGAAVGAGEHEDPPQAATDAPRLLVVSTADLDPGERPGLVRAMGFRAAPPGSTDGDPYRRDWPARERVIDEYDAAAAALGTELAGLLTALDDAAPDRARWSVLAGSSGVSLVEAWGSFEMPVPPLTTNFLLERTIHVPLVVIPPAGSPAVGAVDDVVELVDVLPTVAAIGGAAPPANLPGADLAPLLGGGGLSAAGGDSAYAEFGDMLALRRGPLLVSFRGLVHLTTPLDPRVDEALVDPRTVEEVRHFGLYDVVADPWQRHDLWSERPADGRALREHLIELRRGAAAPPEGALGPAQIDELQRARSDGYW